MRVTVTDLDDSFERVVTIDNNNRDVDQQLYVRTTHHNLMIDKTPALLSLLLCLNKSQITT